MKALLIAVLCAGSARAGLFAAAGDPLAAEQKLFEAGKYAAVVAGLSPERMQRLRSADLDRAYLLLGQSLSRSGQYDKALGVYQVGVRLYPRDLNLLTELAVLLHRSGLHAQAEPLFQQVIKIHPNNAAAQLGLAEIDAALGFLDRSADHYEKALETLGTQSGIWRDYGDVLLRMRDLKTAELAERKALDLRAEDDEARLELARVLRAQARLPEALALLDEVLARHPERAEVALMRGLWLLEQDRYDEALAAANDALAKDDSDPLARWIRARVELKLDRYNQAVADLKAAAAQERSAPFVAKAAESLLERLQGAR